MQTIIAGAGLTGLSCGYALKDATLIEEKPYIGGLAHTFNYNGFRFDIGGHRFLTYKPSINRFVKNLLGNELRVINRKSKIFKDNKFLDYPPSYSIIFDIPVFKSLGILGSYLFRQCFPVREMSFKDKSINRFGGALYNFYFRGYTQKIWGIPCDKISTDWFEARLSNISLKDALKVAFSKRNHKSKSFSGRFLYPAFGIGMLAEKLAKGLRIELNSKLTAINYRENQIRSVVINHGKEYPCDRLISTMPINDLANMLSPPRSVEGALSNLKYRDLICVFLILNVPRLTDWHWIYFPDKEIFGRFHEPKNWSQALANPDKTGICLEIFCNRTDEIWKKKDQSIVDKTMDDLPFKDKSSLADYYIVRIKDAYPVYDIDYGKNLGLVKEFLAGFKNLYIAGRTGGFRYINMDECVKEGLKLGRFLTQL